MEEACNVDRISLLLDILNSVILRIIFDLWPLHSRSPQSSHICPVFLFLSLYWTGRTYLHLFLPPILNFMPFLPEVIEIRLQLLHSS
jgi:hypothetical protein